MNFSLSKIIHLIKYFNLILFLFLFFYKKTTKFFNLIIRHILNIFLQLINKKIMFKVIVIIILNNYSEKS